MNNKIIKLQLGDYFKWKNLSREDKVKRNKQIAKLYLDRGPSILNYYNALKAYFGGFNPKNPYLLTGEPVILPGMNPTKGILTAAKAARTLEDYLKTTKVTAQALEGSSAARSAYATDRYLGGVMFENNLPEAASQIQGHGMAKASTLLENLARLRYILDNGLEKGKTFFTAPLKVSDARIGSALGTGGGKPYFDGHFLITGKPGLMINSVDDIGTIYINDAYENEEALKAAQKMKEYLTKTYPNKVFKLYSEGFKKGGSIKTANARKWKHKSGGLLKFEDGGKNAAPSTKFLSKLWFKNAGNNIGSFLTSDSGKGLLDIGLNILSGYTDYRNASNLLDSQVEQSKASLELSYLDMMLEAMKNRILKLYLLKKLWQLAYLNGETLDNYSDIVASNMGWKEYSLSLLNAEQLKKQLEALIDLLAKQAKGNALGSLFGSVVLSGLGVLGNVLGNKNSTATQNLLNNSTIGKSTNPYMYTGLGANYNASTFFK